MSNWKRIKPYAMPFTWVVVGVIVGAIGMYQLFMRAVNPYNHFVDNVAIHVAPLKMVHSAQAGNDPALRALWFSAQDYISIAGHSYDQFDESTQRRLIRYVAQIDEAAPYFKSSTQQGLKSTKKSRSIRKCIMRAKISDTFDVVDCVRNVSQVPSVATH